MSNPVKVDQWGLGPAHYAARSGSVAGLAAALGAHPHTLELRDNYGRTPLSFAAREGHIDAVRYLLELGADRNAPDNYGRTPATFAAREGKADVVALLNAAMPTAVGTAPQQVQQTQQTKQEEAEKIQQNQQTQSTASKSSGQTALDLLLKATRTVGDVDDDRDSQRELAAWLSRTLGEQRRTLASDAVTALVDVVHIAKVASGVLGVAVALCEAHARSSANDRRVSSMLMRMNELRAIVEQVRDFIGEQIVRTADRSGGVRRETVLAMQAPLERLLAACTDARSAIAAWQTVSATASEHRFAAFKAWMARTAGSARHADRLAAANGELREALAALGHVAALRSALSTAEAWAGDGADLRAWLRAQAAASEAFERALLEERGELRQLIHELVPEIDAVVARHVGDVRAELAELRKELAAARIAGPAAAGAAADNRTDSNSESGAHGGDDAPADPHFAPQATAPPM